MLQHLLRAATRQFDSTDSSPTARYLPSGNQRIDLPQSLRDAARRVEIARMGDFSLGSLFFQDNGYLFTRESAAGEALSPKLAWSNPPADVRSYVVLMENSEPDAAPRTHWLRFNLPGHLDALPEGQPRHGVAGTNDFGHQGYEGPAAPADFVDHHYRFVLLALDTPTLPLPPGAPRDQVEAALAPHLLARTELNCRYRRWQAEPAGAGC